ncbi:MAG: DUF1611 domain-containing protein [Candidatus Thermoplasmatota archaeon]|nr:DUF1611 domain-containing protein [Candidatus Thermoplasmatota archaeon]
MEKKRALVYVEGLFHCADGKTAHGLVRHSDRFDVVCVIDSTLPEGDAGDHLDGVTREIPFRNDLKKSIKEYDPDVFIIGAVSEGGVLPIGYDQAVIVALTQGLDVVSGLHQFLSDDPVFMELAKTHNCQITDVRKMFRDHKRVYTGEIKKVKSKRIALIGTDSAIGKRTLAVLLTKELRKRGKKADMIYTGQTGWMQGWPHGVVIDALINDFVAGGIEDAILASWNDDTPDVMIIEGQGSLVHPFFPGGFEILTAGNIDGFILVDAPKRKNLDGFPDYPMPDPARVVRIAELLTEKPLLGIGLNNENMTEQDITDITKRMEQTFNVPTVEPFSQGVNRLVDRLETLEAI